jgi:hypothetical protein
MLPIVVDVKTIATDFNISVIKSSKPISTEMGAHLHEPTDFAATTDDVILGPSATQETSPATNAYDESMVDSFIDESVSKSLKFISNEIGDRNVSFVKSSANFIPQLDKDQSVDMQSSQPHDGDAFPEDTPRQGNASQLTRDNSSDSLCSLEEMAS